MATEELIDKDGSIRYLLTYGNSGSHTSDRFDASDVAIEMYNKAISRGKDWIWYLNTEVLAEVKVKEAVRLYWETYNRIKYGMV